MSKDKTSIPPEQARAMMEQLLGKVMESTGAPTDDPAQAAQALPQALMGLFGQALSQATSGAGSAPDAPADPAPEGGILPDVSAPHVTYDDILPEVSAPHVTYDDVDPEPVAASEPDPASARPDIQDELKGVFGRYVAENPSLAAKIVEGELNVDAEVVGEHAGPLLGALLGAMAKSLVPEDLSVDVPVEGDGGDPVNLKLDLGGMLTRMFTPPAGKE